MISVCTTETFHINSSFWCAPFKFVLACSVQMAFTYNIRFLLFFGFNGSNLGFHSTWKVYWFSGRLLVITRGRLEVFRKYFVSLFLVEVTPSITIILFSNVIPFNLRISFCTCSGTNANAKLLHFPLFSFTGMFILHVTLWYLVDLKPSNS